MWRYDLSYALMWREDWSGWYLPPPLWFWEE